MCGGFSALRALFAIVAGKVVAGSCWPIGVRPLVMGLSFCLGLILVVVGGAELFTGNNLIVMAWAGGRVRTTMLLRNWAIVYVGNLVGAVVTAVLVFGGRQYTFGGGLTGLQALSMA